MVTDNEAGFALLETLVALAIVAIGLGSLMPIFAKAYQHTNAIELRTQALAIANSVMNENRSYGFARQVESEAERQGWTVNLVIAPANGQTFDQVGGYESVMRVAVHSDDGANSSIVVALQASQWVRP